MTKGKQDFDPLDVMVIDKAGVRGVKNLSYRLRKGFVPACIYTNGTAYEATAYEDCNYVLVGVSESAGVDSEVVVPLFGVSVTCIILQGTEKAYVYAKVDQYIVTKAKSLLCLLTRHFNGLYDSVYWDEPFRPEALFRDRWPEREQMPQLTIAQADALGATKITSAHHIHFIPSEVLASIPASTRENAYKALRLPADANSVMAAGVLLWYSTLEGDMQKLVEGTGLFKCKTVKEWLALGKSLSVEAKSLQNLLDIDLRQVFECDVLVNRIDGSVDWTAEKEHRTKPNTTLFTYDTVFSRACAIFQQASFIGRKPVKMEWKQFWNSRWQWSAAGSVHSQYPMDEKFVVRTDRNLKNKFIMLTNMPSLTIEYFLSRQPEIHAWASTKYEWGKLRAIYGTDTTSYVLSNFVFYNCENVLPNRFPVGKDANDRNVTGRVAGVLANRLPYCLDFEDFNSQHSISSMRAVVDAYGSVFSKALSGDQLAALNWTSESLERQVIHDNVGLNETYSAKATLLSGWRLTTFVNSVLNAIYTDFMLEGVKQRGCSLHNGDDVLIGATNLVVAQRTLQRGRRLNIRAQPSKCAFGAIAEFLRVDHVRGSKGQYLTRAVATAVHSRIESKPSTDARDLVNSMESRFADCLNRGMTVPQIAALRHIYYKRQSIICNMTVEELYTIKMTHRVAGGISEALDSRLDMYIGPGDTKEFDIEIPQLPGVYDYAVEVAKTLEMEDRTKQMVDRIYKATYEAVTPKNRKMKITVNKEEQWCTYVRAIYKAFKGTMPVAGFGKAALVGFALDVLQARGKETTLVQALNRSKQPERLLGYLI